MTNKQFKRTTVTSALPYANGGVHIGHLAGVYVPADIYVRYLRLKKEDVLFIGGSDEHGVPITSVNIGGMSFKEGKHQITGAVSVDDKDIEAFKKLNEKGIELEIRKVDTDSKVMLMDVLK